MTTTTKMLTNKEKKMAESAFREIRSRGGKGNVTEVRMRIGKNEVVLPESVIHLLEGILHNMADGKSVSLLPSEAIMSTQKAAQILSVSRPHMVQLLESGQIPFTKAGSHRRIALSDLMTYKETARARRKKNLDLLAKQAQELDLGY